MPAKQTITVTRTRTRTKRKPQKKIFKNQKRCPTCGKYSK
nr:MAG TPA: Protein of unknown function (DUF983) [Caudoviricetes sp.]